MRAHKQLTKLQNQLQKNPHVKENITAHQTIRSHHPTYQPRSLKTNQNPLETSFESDAKPQHAQVIWEASLSFVKTCFCSDGQIIKDGLNDEQIFVDAFEEEEGTKEVEDIILRNKLLENRQIQQFLVDLNYERDFKRLLQSLCELYREEVFQQIFYICHDSWEKYLRFKQETKLSPTLANMNFSTVLNFDEGFEPEVPNQFLDLNCAQIIKQSEKIADEISGLIFLNKKIKFVNLMEAERKKKKVDVREEFKNFIKSIVKGVFYCLEGYYIQPNQQEIEENERIMFSDSEDSAGEDQESGDEEPIGNWGLKKRRKLS